VLEGLPPAALPFVSAAVGERQQALGARASVAYGRAGAVRAAPARRRSVSGTLTRLSVKMRKLTL
jgi:hypothetical protein